MTEMQSGRSPAPRIFVVANQKGGVGKTTTAVNLAAALARHGQRTLLVDLDPQGNATMGSGIDKRALKRSVYHVLIGLADVVDATQRSENGGYDVLPANRDLAGAELDLVDFEARESRLKDALEAVLDRYEIYGSDAATGVADGGRDPTQHSGSMVDLNSENDRVLRRDRRHGLEDVT